MSSSINEQSQPPDFKSSAARLVWNLAIPVLFIAVVILFFHSRGKFEFSLDEGLELMKGALVEAGYPLYNPVWSDQPPIMTYAIAAVIRLAGMDVGTARLMVLISAAVLLWSAYKFLEIEYSKWHGLIAVVLIFMLPKFMVLSVSVMAGLPAISLAMLGLLLVVFWHHNRRTWLLPISALLLAVSIFTKLFTGFLAPIILAGILVDSIASARKGTPWIKALAPAVLWGLVFAAASAILLFGTVGWSNLPFLLNVHFQAPENQAFTNVQYSLLWYLGQSAALLVLGVLGAVFSLREKKWMMGYLIAWAITAILLFINYRPIWDHQLLIITIPIAMLAAISVYKALVKLAEVFRPHVQWNAQSVLLLLSLGVLILLVFDFHVPEPLSLMNPRPSLTSSGLELGPVRVQFLEEIRKYQDQTHWIVTDLPMYAFRTGLLVPPEIAVISAKRYETGNFTDDDLLAVLRKYQPEQVLLGRFDYPSIDGYLDLNYHIVHTDDEIKLFIRNDLVAPE
ncbi:MAG: ArnT family glycosyltransferase [Anaerolineales bacterium]